jgi:hypothetical protein
MRTSEIQIGMLYAVGEGQYRDRRRGIVLSLEPHRMSIEYRTGRQLSRLQPDPQGRGYREGRSRISGSRGLPMLLAVVPYRFDEQALPELTDEELHALAQQLIADGFTGDELGEDRRAFANRRAVLEMVRPQAIERLWVDHLEIERRDREARQAEAERRDRVQRLAWAEHGGVVDLLVDLGIEYRPPVSRTGGDDRQSVVGQMSWQELANLLHEVAERAAEPLHHVVQEALSEVNDDDVPHMIGAEHLRRMREIVGPVKFDEAGS